MSQDNHLESDLEARLARLEENLFFQDRKLEELDKEIVEIRKERDIQARRLEQIQKMLLHLREVLDSQISHTHLPDPPPPHYQQR